MTIDDVAPDNVDDAVRFVRQSLRDGTWNGDVAEMLLNKQRDSTELRKALYQLSNEAPPASAAAGPRRAT